eukprot:scaffold733_cov97-Cylindrotheca_fusiformis.AAC.6
MWGDFVFGWSVGDVQHHPSTSKERWQETAPGGGNYITLQRTPDIVNFGVSIMMARVRSFDVGSILIGRRKRTTPTPYILDADDHCT